MNDGNRPRRQVVLSKRGNNAKIHRGLGFIWGIPDLIRIVGCAASH